MQNFRDPYGNQSRRLSQEWIDRINVGAVMEGKKGKKGKLVGATEYWNLLKDQGFPDLPSKDAISKRFRRHPERQAILNRTVGVKVKNWTVAGAIAEEAKLILEVKFRLYVEYDIHRIMMSKEEASEIVKVCRIAPDMPPATAGHVGTAYYVHQQYKESAMDLDEYLSFAPWRSPSRWKAYTEAMLNFRIPPVHHELLPYLLFDVCPALTEEAKGTYFREVLENIRKSSEVPREERGH